VPRLLEENSIELVLLPEDNFYYLHQPVRERIHARGGKAVIVPFTIVNVLEWREAFKAFLARRRDPHEPDRRHAVPAMVLRTRG
jgi:hypothetical protein